MVEVFRTNVQAKVEAENLIQCLVDHFPSCRITIDLSDCDRVLRIESRDSLDINVVMVLASKRNLRVEVMEG